LEGGIIMNCKKCDRYVSLYLDEALDTKRKIEFVKHVEECSQCAAKLKEAISITDLCREDQDIEPPESFSASLHKQLLGINTKDSKSKFEIFMYNKKVIASLSTAAILMVSLLAYNLLPHMGLSKASTSMANDTAQVEASKAVSDDYSSSKVKSSIQAEGATENNSPLNDTTIGSQADSKETTQDAKVTITFSEPIINEETKIKAQAKKFQDKAETSIKDNESSERKVKEDATNFIIASDNKSDTNKYFSNYSELNLKVSTQRIEIDSLRKLMKELGAIELKSVTINGVVGNSVESTVNVLAETSATTSEQTVLESPEYIDYYLSLSLYNTLANEVTKYNLVLSTKTDIIRNDITDKYNVLNTRKSEIDKKIEEANIKGEDTSTFEAEKIELTQKINKIIAENEMITVRFFYK
jgi:hypothetical protein